MIPANKKVSFTEVPAGLTNQLSQTFATNDGGAKETPVEKIVLSYKEKTRTKTVELQIDNITRSNLAIKF